jgi:hypothetical protein
MPPRLHAVGEARRAHPLADGRVLGGRTAGRPQKKAGRRDDETDLESEREWASGKDGAYARTDLRLGADLTRATRGTDPPGAA